mgnify:CR=1 FL=1
MENVMIPALIAGTSSKEATARALEILSFMGLAERASHKPNELSGGEKQRVAVSRALINNPAVILADEPSGSLDTHNKEELHQLFFKLRDQLGQTNIDHDSFGEVDENGERLGIPANIEVDLPERRPVA